MAVMVVMVVMVQPMETKGPAEAGFSSRLNHWSASQEDRSIAKMMNFIPLAETFPVN